MTAKKLITYLSKAGFTAEEIFYIIAYCIYKELENVTVADIKRFIPEWRRYMTIRYKYLEKNGANVYDDGLSDDDSWGCL